MGGAAAPPFCNCADRWLVCVRSSFLGEHILCSCAIIDSQRGLPFTYKMKTNAAGEKLGEMIVDRRGGKTITRGTVVLAYKKALELGGLLTGPKKLGVFGASYIYPVFVEIGVYGKSVKE